MNLKVNLSPWTVKKFFFSVRLCCIFKIDQRCVSNDNKDTNNQSYKQIFMSFFYFTKVEVKIKRKTQAKKYILQCLYTQKKTDNN